MNTKHKLIHFLEKKAENKESITSFGKGIKATILSIQIEDNRMRLILKRSSGSIFSLNLHNTIALMKDYKLIENKYLENSDSIDSLVLKKFIEYKVTDCQITKDSANESYHMGILKEFFSKVKI